MKRRVVIRSNILNYWHSVSFMTASTNCFLNRCVSVVVGFAHELHVPLGSDQKGLASQRSRLAFPVGG